MDLKLFIPGPTEVRKEILKAQEKPLIGHRMPEFSKLYEEIIEGLKKVLKTQNDVFVFTSSATGVMEGSIRSFVQKKVLSITNGAFGERWHKIAVECGKEVDWIQLEWGKGLDPEILKDALKKKTYEAVLVTHNESSTGVMNPLKEIADEMKNYPDTLLIVDAVSSLSGVPVEIDKWGIDVIFASVQKCFALPPGLTIAVANEKALEKAKKVKNRGYYFDFLIMKKYYDERRQTPATPAITLLYALKEQIKRILSEGLENRYRRHLEMAEYTRDWVRKYFELFPEEGYESITLTCVKNTRGIDVNWLISELRKRGMIISNGYGKLKGKTFRIGHMGDLTLNEIKELLSIIEEILELQQ